MGENNTMSPADIAALTKNGNGGFGSEGGLAWLILIFLVLGMAGFNGRGAGPAPMPIPPNVATQTDVQNAINNQTINNGLNQIALSSANNNYETAQLVNGQTNALMQQNYANQINAIQGFNSVNQGMIGGFNSVVSQLVAQTNQLSSKLDQMSYQQEQCCCRVLTQMLENRLDDRDRQLTVAQNQISNMQQTQNILGATGRFVAWAGNGAQAASVVTG